MKERPAMLLVGPTGSGKTPLGDALEARGLHGRPCAHFDFGRELRRVADGQVPEGVFGPDEVAFVRRVLDEGALLENEHFPLARKVLAGFLSRCGPATLVVLNGLPRHAGQARDVDDLVAVEAVARLTCSPEVAWERVRANAGGDRAGRTDDDLESVRKKLALFQRRTVPLLEHYRERGIPIVEIDTTAKSRPDEALEELVAAL